MHLAIQEHLLPGDNLIERLNFAKQIGLEGVEFSADGLTERVPQVVAALQQADLRASGVNLGTTKLLHPDFEVREEALVTVRRAMANALDLGALGAVFIPTDPQSPRMPDLHPYKSSIELEAEMLVMQLRATLCDLAYAMGAMLYMAPVNRYKTHLIRKLDHAARILEKNDTHPHAKIAANLFHMAMEEDDVITTLQKHIGHIGYIYLVDSNGHLPGAGLLDFEVILKALKDAGYAGWLTITGDAADYHTQQIIDSVTKIKPTL